ncbi:MAG TPA: hypothetical protein VF132_11765 [Rudaea sp.]
MRTGSMDARSAMRLFTAMNATAALLFTCAMAVPTFARAFPHKGVATLSAGGYHTCAVLADHHVVCWGAETTGAPTLIQGITTAVSVTSGLNFACALLLDHTVQCWGDNSVGQLGDGTTTSRHYPAATRFFGNVNMISAGKNHVCAQTDEWMVYCWGSNSKGQLGNWAFPAGDGNYSPNPIYAAWHSGDGSKYFLARPDVAAGGDHSCAYGAYVNNASYCWGTNNSGELGGGGATYYFWETPVRVIVPNGSDWVPLVLTYPSLVAGNAHTCGLVPDGGPAGLNTNSIACWGTNQDGAIGQPVGDYTGVPAAVMMHPDMSGHSSKFYDIAKLAAGNNFTCALETNSYLQCWGKNDRGQLGNPSFTDGSSQWPIGHGLVANFTEIAAGAEHACGLRNGSVICWGSNLLGQHGDGTLDSSPHPEAHVAAVDAPIFTDNFDNN